MTLGFIDASSLVLRQGTCNLFPSARPPHRQNAEPKPIYCSGVWSLSKLLHIEPFTQYAAAYVQLYRDILHTHSHTTYATYYIAVRAYRTNTPFPFSVPSCPKKETQINYVRHHLTFNSVASDDMQRRRKRTGQSQASSENKCAAAKTKTSKVIMQNVYKWIRDRTLFVCMCFCVFVPKWCRQNL